MQKNIPGQLSLEAVSDEKSAVPTEADEHSDTDQEVSAPDNTTDLSAEEKYETE